MIKKSLAFILHLVAWPFTKSYGFGKLTFIFLFNLLSWPVRKIYRYFRPLPLPAPARKLNNIEKIAELITDEGVLPENKKIPVLGIPTWWSPEPGFNPTPAEIKLKRWSVGPGYGGRVKVRNHWEERLGPGSNKIDGLRKQTKKES